MRDVSAKKWTKTKGGRKLLGVAAACAVSRGSVMEVMN